MKNEKYLPIGTIVKVKNQKPKLMIIGYCKSISVDKKQDRDYVACIYPQGILNLRESLAFKHEQIEEVLFEGYKDYTYDAINLMYRTIDMEKREDVKYE